MNQITTSTMSKTSRRATPASGLSAVAAALLAGVTVLGAASASAQTTTMPSRAEREARMKDWTTNKGELEKMLGTGHDKAHYRQALEKAGYAITAVNRDTADYAEWEIVKGGQSYEVQVNFKDGKSTKVDVATNVWKAPGTKTALNDKNYKYVYPTAVTSDADRVSDRVRAKAWTTEKADMERKLGIGHDRAYYKPALEKMGYKVTAVNEADPRNLEYEIVKGDTTYEVQVDFDAATKKSTRVDVSTNMWERPTTEVVKGDKK